MPRASGNNVINLEIKGPPLEYSLNLQATRTSAPMPGLFNASGGGVTICSRVLLRNTRCRGGNIIPDTHYGEGLCLGTPCVTWVCYSSTASIADTHKKKFRDESVPARPHSLPFEGTSNPSVPERSTPNAVSKHSALLILTHNAPGKTRVYRPSFRVASSRSTRPHARPRGAFVPAPSATQLPLHVHPQLVREPPAGQD